MDDLEFLRMIQQEKAEREQKRKNGKAININVKGDLHLGRARVNGNGHYS